MTLGQYNNEKGWNIPENEDPNTEGYCVMSENGEFNFVEKAKFETEAHKYKDCWVGKTNQFLYLINHGDHLDDFSKRYLNHEEATLCYEELELR